MTKDLKTLPDEEVKACWNLHHALAEAAYKRLREISAEEAALVAALEAAP